MEKQEEAERRLSREDLLKLAAAAAGASLLAGRPVGPAQRSAVDGQAGVVRRPRDARDGWRVPPLRESVGPDRRRAQAIAEAAQVEEAPCAADLVVRDQPVGGLRVGRPLDRL